MSQSGPVDATDDDQILRSSVATNRRQIDASALRVLFSDVDGTLVHYPPGNVDEKNESKNEDGGVLYLPPSSTGMRGVISRETLRVCQLLRGLSLSDDSNLSPFSESSERVEKPPLKLVLVSGMRTSTLLQRLPYLPLADAYCSENGGRIFFLERIKSDETELDGSIKKDDETVMFKPLVSNSNDGGEAYRLREDSQWREAMSSPEAAGGDGFEALVPTDESSTRPPLQHRRGKLWVFARRLVDDGWVLDDRGYATCFRVHFGKQTDKEKLGLRDTSHFQKRLMEIVPDGLVASVNLGCVDVYPESSGKKKCCQYLMKKFSGGTLEDNGIFLCDDDNDLDLALSCMAAFVPSITSKSMEDMIRQHPTRIFLAESLAESLVNELPVRLGTTAATDVILKYILGLCSTG